MGDVQPIMSPAEQRDAIVLAWLPSSRWGTEDEAAVRTWLSVSAVRMSLRRLFDAGRAMRRPGATGTEWKRT